MMEYRSPQSPLGRVEPAFGIRPDLPVHPALRPAAHGHMADFYREMRSFLTIKHRVAEIEGDVINAGDKFRIRFTVDNLFPVFSSMFGWPTGMKVEFKDPWVHLHCTEVARILDEQGREVAHKTWNFEETLNAYRTIDFEVEFKALQALEPLDQNPLETICHATVHADLDLDKFAQIQSERVPISAQIYPG